MYMRHIIGLALCIALGIAIASTMLHSHREVQRLRANNETLTERMLLYRTKHDKYAASVAEMRLTINELRQQHADAIAEIRNLEVKLRRVERYNRTATATIIRDTLIIREIPKSNTPPQPERDYDDGWVRISGTIAGDTMALEVVSHDTLHQVLHRIPRRFLGIPFGTKYLRQEVWSSNPHTRIVYSEVLRIDRHARR